MSKRYDFDNRTKIIHKEAILHKFSGHDSHANEDVNHAN